MDQIRIAGLESLVSATERRRTPPVESWNPPYCGDIGLHINGQGQWFYQGSPILRKPLVQLFASILRCDADGRHYLVTPMEKVDVRVDDAPFLAVEMDVSGGGRDQSLIFRTNVDDIVRCDIHHPLEILAREDGIGQKPYVLVRGRLKALVTRALFYDLAELALEQKTELDGENSSVGIWSGGAFFPFPM